MRRDATEWLLLYDADCGFCRWSLGWMLRADRRRRLRPVALQSDEAQNLLADLTPERRMASWHLVAPDGRRWSAGHAAPPLLRLLPGGRPAAAILAATPALTDRVYRLIASHRSTLGRLIPQGARRRAKEQIEARA